MRYVENIPFMAVTGQPFEIEDKDAGMPKHEAAFGEVLLITLKSYRPSQPHFLDTLGLRSYNRCLDILEKPPKQPPYYGFEDTDFKVLRLVCEWMLPLVPWFRNAPTVEDLLGAATTEVPKTTLPKVELNGSEPVREAVAP